MNVLFVCSENRLRSPTAEIVFSRYDELNTKSAGLGAFAGTPVSTDLIEWADVILVMEEMHRHTIERQFGDLLRGKRLACLDIPDQYGFMQPELVELLEQRVRRHVPVL